MYLCPKGKIHLKCLSVLSLGRVNFHREAMEARPRRSRPGEEPITDERQAKSATNLESCTNEGILSLRRPEPALASTRHFQLPIIHRQVYIAARDDRGKGDRVMRIRSAIGLLLSCLIDIGHC